MDQKAYRELVIFLLAVPKRYGNGWRHGEKKFLKFLDSEILRGKERGRFKEKLCQSVNRAP
jgi:hypothetical protein